LGNFARRASVLGLVVDAANTDAASGRYSQKKISCIVISHSKLGKFLEIVPAVNIDVVDAASGRHSQKSAL